MVVLAAGLLAPCPDVGPVVVAGALKVSVSIPDLVKLNDAFWLNCSHQSRSGSSGRLGGEIYGIKWYKDEEEFYRFLPSAEPKVSIYETNGIQLDVSSDFLASTAQFAPRAPEAEMIYRRMQADCWPAVSWELELAESMARISHRFLLLLLLLLGGRGGPIMSSDRLN